MNEQNLSADINPSFYYSREEDCNAVYRIIALEHPDSGRFKLYRAELARFDWI
jgi:hypothetical protein